MHTCMCIYTWIHTRKYVQNVFQCCTEVLLAKGTQSIRSKSTHNSDR